VNSSYQTLYIILAGTLGAIVGSFLNVCVYRIPRSLSIVFPGSQCPNCKTHIAFYDNIPILSYLILKGKCRHCHAPISIKYPLVEAMNAVLYLGIFLKFGLSFTTLVYFIFVSILIVVSFIDFGFRIIPDGLSFSGIVLGFLSSLFILQITWLQSLLGILIGGGLLLAVALTYEKITHKEGMGGGDVKLLAMIGAFTGWQGIPFVILVSSFVGAIVGIIFIILTKKDTKFAIPFGPFLSFAAILYIFLGPKLIRWYLSIGRVG
jgi:leader peptidase (prepilin peptidase)/N-methyltransferase